MTDQVAGHENDGSSKSQGVKMQDMKMQDVKMHDLKIHDTKTKGMKRYCLLARHLPGASLQRFNVV